MCWSGRREAVIYDLHDEAGNERLQHDRENCSKAGSHISVTRKVQIPNSTDLSFGRRPESKPVEFGICTLLVVEILAILSMKRLKRLMQSLVTRLGRRNRRILLDVKAKRARTGAVSRAHAPVDEPDPTGPWGSSVRELRPAIRPWGCEHSWHPLG